MASIAEIRAQFPQYEDVDDVTLSRALHGKYYSDIPFADFATTIGLAPEAYQSNPAGKDAVVTGVAGGARTGLEQAMQGTTFGFGDEVMDTLGAVFAKVYDKTLGDNVTEGQSISDLVGEARGNSQQRIKKQIEENPEVAIPSQIAGALLTGGAGATTKAGAGLGNAMRSGNLLSRVTKGAALGGVSSGITGIGTGSGVEGRLDNGLDSIGPGAGIGAAFPIAGKALTLAGKPLQGGLDMTARYLARRNGELQVPEKNKAMEKVFKRMAADHPEELDRILNSYAATKGKALIEVGGARTANLAEGAAQFPSGGAKAAEFFDEATGLVPDKLKVSATKNISPSTNYYDTLDEIMENGHAKASPIYKQAYKNNPSIGSSEINRILDTPAGNTALKDAVRIMRNERKLVGMSDDELVHQAQLAGSYEPGSGGIASGLKLETLDWTKKALDRAYENSKSLTNPSGDISILSVKKDLVSALDSADKSGMYAKARKISGDYLSNKKAMDLGLNFLSDDHQLVARKFNKLGDNERRSYKAGALAAIRNNIDPKTDGLNVTRVFNNPASRKKLSTILSPKEYESLRAEIAAGDKLYKLRNQVLGNSRTAQRQLAAEEFRPETQEFLTDVAKNGVREATMKRGVSVIKNQFQGMSDKMADDVSKILYETDPKKKYAIVKNLANRAKNKTPQGTQAAQKLKAFYTLSDGLQKANKFVGTRITAPATITGGEITSTINPPEELPEVNLPKVNFTPVTE